MPYLGRGDRRRSRSSAAGSTWWTFTTLGVETSSAPAARRMAAATTTTNSTDDNVVGDEGGFAPDLASSQEAIDAILEAAERAGHRENVAIALDPAASEFFSDGVYRFEGREADGPAMSDFYAG